MPYGPHVTWLETFMENNAYPTSSTELIPSAGHTLIEHLRYGNWTGAAYSGKHNSPSFLAIDNAFEPGKDKFDEISKKHDLAQDAAQQQLLLDLQNRLVSPQVAFSKYYGALATADQEFLSDPDSQTDLDALLAGDHALLPDTEWGIMNLVAAVHVAIPRTLPDANKQKQIHEDAKTHNYTVPDTDLAFKVEIGLTVDPNGIPIDTDVGHWFIKLHYFAKILDGAKQINAGAVVGQAAQDVLNDIMANLRAAVLAAGGDGSGDGEAAAQTAADAPEPAPATGSDAPEARP